MRQLKKQYGSPWEEEDDLYVFGFFFFFFKARDVSHAHRVAS